MITGMNELTPRQQKDLKVLSHFIDLSCRSRHRGRQTTVPEPVISRLVGRPRPLCPECLELLDYAARRLRSCPLDPKPSCKKCPVHCYRPDFRARIRETMTWSGKRMILRGRLDLIRHYFF